jgi:hypothetical protein
MEDHETRRKLIREWMALPKDKRQTEEQAAAFSKSAAQKNEFHRSRRDPSRKFRRDPYQKLMGWLLPRAQRRNFGWIVAPKFPISGFSRFKCSIRQTLGHRCQHYGPLYRECSRV